MKWFLIILLLLALITPVMTPLEEDIVIKAGIMLAYISVMPKVVAFMELQHWSKEVLFSECKKILNRSENWCRLRAPIRARGPT